MNGTVSLPMEVIRHIPSVMEAADRANYYVEESSGFRFVVEIRETDGNVDAKDGADVPETFDFGFREKK